ncbi:MAG: 6-pyruvoyl trahydropterin synthase family protein [Candidatus Muiribacteriota bacterium]
MRFLGVKQDFSSAHFLKNYDGKCCNLHGHNWYVEAIFEGGELQEKTFISEDFGVLKKLLKKVLDELDHKCLNDIKYFKEKNPTAEIISEYIYNELLKKGEEENINSKLSCIKVWESDKTWVSFGNQP